MRIAISAVTILLLMGNVVASPAAIKTFSFPVGLNNASVMAFVKGRERIWILQKDANSYEFDIKTGSWTALGKAIGNSQSENGSNLVEDPYEPGWLWSPNFYAGLLHYNLIDRSSQTYTVRPYFGDEPPTAVAPAKNRIWVGTAHGLYFLSRSTRKAVKVEALGKTWIKSLAVDGDKIWVNGDLYVEDSSLQVKKVSGLEGWPIKEIRNFSFVPPYKISFDPYGETKIVIVGPGDKIATSLKDVSGYFATQGKGAIWLHWGDIARFDLKTSSITEIYAGIHGGASWLYEDGNSLVFLADHYLARINRETQQMEVGQKTFTALLRDGSTYWVLSPHDGLMMVPKANLDQMFATDDSLMEGRERIRDLGQLLRDEEDIVKRIKYVAELFELLQKDKESRGANISAVEGIRRLMTMKDGGGWYVPKLNVAQLSEREKPVAYYVLATSSFETGKPVEAMEYYEILKKSYPGSASLGWITKHDAEVMLTTKKKYLEISSKKMSEEQRLWELGNLYYDAMRVEWNVLEVGFNPNLAFGYFDELIRRYPDRPLAKAAQQKMDAFYEERGD